MFVDRGYKGVEVDHVQIWRSGQKRGVTRGLKAMIRRRSAIEPTIGHMKSDGKLGRNWLKGTFGAALNVVLYRSPCLEIPGCRIFPPVPVCRGVRPNHAANCRPLRKPWMSVAVAARAVAVSGPMPGMVCNACICGFSLPKATRRPSM